MIRLLVVAVVAIYTILLVFGDESRRPEVVARSALEVEVIAAAYLPSDEEPAPSTYVSPISATEAVQIAVQAGEDLRNSRTAKVLRGAVAVADEPTSPVTEANVETASVAPALWNVTGSRVNLRSGPGTSNAVVGQVTQGTQAEMLAEADGWYQIRSADGSSAGWIFGKFLQPG